MSKNKKKKVINLNKVFPIVIFMITIFMGIGYASINSIIIGFDGEAVALSQDGVYIVEAKPLFSSIGENELASTKSTVGTLFNSTTTLSSLKDSEVTYEITVYNSSEKTYYFNEVKLLEDETTYSNNNIGYRLEGISHGDILTPTGSDMAYKTFRITFYYKDSDKISDNVLNSIINFHFDEFYNIDYINVSNSEAFPSKIVKGGTLTIQLNDVLSRELIIKSGDKELIINSEYTYNESTGILVVPNILDNIIVFVNSQIGDYTVLDYIQSNGKQYIDTGVRGRSGLKADITLSFNNLGAAVDDYGILGARMYTDEVTSTNASHYQRTYLLHYYKGFAHGYGMYYNSSILLSNEKKYNVHSELNIGNQFVSVDGSNITSTSLTDDVQLELNLYLFAINQDGSPHYPSSINLYHCRIYDENDDLIRDFIPVMRNSDGEIGLYDLVENKFYPNQGDGEFTGSVAKAKYTYISYVKTTGTQYIDTGVNAKTGLSSEIVLSIDDFNGINDFGILGARVSSTRIYLLHYYNGFTYGYGGYYSMGKSLNVNQKYSISTNLNVGNQVLNVDGEKLNGTSTSRYDLNTNLYLFAINNSNSVTFTAPSLTLYSCKIYDENGNLIRDFKPAIRNSNFTVGLYDEVNSIFYPSLSADDFIGE